MKNSSKSTKKTKIAEKFGKKVEQKSMESEIFTIGIKNLFVLKPLQGGSHEKYS